MYIYMYIYILKGSQATILTDDTRRYGLDLLVHERQDFIDGKFVPHSLAPGPQGCIVNSLDLLHCELRDGLDGDRFPLVGREISDLRGV